MHPNAKKSYSQLIDPLTPYQVYAHRNQASLMLTRKFITKQSNPPYKVLSDAKAVKSKTGLLVTTASPTSSSQAFNSLLEAYCCFILSQILVMKNYLNFYSSTLGAISLIREQVNSLIREFHHTKLPYKQVTNTMRFNPIFDLKSFKLDIFPRYILHRYYFAYKGDEIGNSLISKQATPLQARL
ncbi:Hypothetical_protein [Hexamita inflata]|uniref:Hypothetical_protein n=1 Tax=Hexamita inflata TaxID=28002 RepID=A0ABP1IZW2_9EUKA